jgi:hypothetical protein
VAFMLGRDVIQSPGTAYEYNSGTAVLPGEIIRRFEGLASDTPVPLHTVRISRQGHHLCPDRRRGVESAT